MDEAKRHINVLKLRAATLALKALLQSQEPQHPQLKHINLRIESTTAVAYVNKRRGTRSPVPTELPRSGGCGSPPNCPELYRTATDSRPFRCWWIAHCCYSAPISVVSPISANSIPSPVEVPSSKSLAAIRDHYQATGLSKEFVDTLLTSWGMATQKRY